MHVINRFHGEYACLSNFYPVSITVSAPVPVGGGYSAPVIAPSVEHAYQAMKARGRADWERIIQADTPGKAKRLGRSILVREDWDEVALLIMHELLIQKFRHQELRAFLLQTSPAVLIEGNDWGDRFWGEVEGEGENWLGRLLMMVRDGIEMRAKAG
jgi:ribA/ribD-fused uncharacterized protein